MVVDVVRRLVEHRLPKLVVAVLQDTRRRPIRFVPVPVRKRQGCQLTCAVAWPRRDHHAGGRAAVADLAAADPGRSPGQAIACRSWIYPRAPGFGPGGRARARPTSPATGSAPGPGPQQACWPWPAGGHALPGTRRWQRRRPAPSPSACPYPVRLRSSRCLPPLPQAQD